MSEERENRAAGEKRSATPEKEAELWILVMKEKKGEQSDLSVCSW